MKLIWTNESQRLLVHRHIDALPLAEVVHGYYAEFGLYKPRRTDPQNNRLWALHSLAAREFGCSAEDMHEDMLCSFFGFDEVILPSGVIKRIPLKRSSTRNIEEFSDFMTYCEGRYAGELGICLE